jgi:hypothetical protein
MFRYTVNYFRNYIAALGFLSCGWSQQIYPAHDFSQQFSLAFNRSRSFQDSFVFVSTKLITLDIGHILRHNIVTHMTSARQQLGKHVPEVMLSTTEGRLKAGIVKSQ